MAHRRLGFWRRFFVVLLKPPLTVLTKRTWYGMEHIPRTGGVIIAVNHNSHADPLVFAHFIYDAGRWPRFLAKASLFKVPVLGYLLKVVGQIPVYRGTTDAVKALREGIAGVEAGHALCIYPEGTTTREPDLWPMRGKTGVARLALATGAPVVPVAHWGGQRFYHPISKRKRISFRTPVAVAAGPPVDLSRWRNSAADKTTLEEISDEIMLRIRDLLAEIRGEQPPPLYEPARARAAAHARPERQPAKRAGDGHE